MKPGAQTAKLVSLAVGYENHKPYPVPKSVPEMFRGSRKSNKGLKDGIIGVIIRQNVYLISAKKIEFQNLIFLTKMTFLNFQGYENHK